MGTFELAQPFVSPEFNLSASPAPRRVAPLTAEERPSLLSSLEVAGLYSLRQFFSFRVTFVLLVIFIHADAACVIFSL